MSDIKFRHGNDSGEVGHRLGDGRIYPIDIEAARHDNAMWITEGRTREEMRRKIMGKDVKVLIGVPTAEYARRADFYDFFNLLDKPIGSIITLSHAQSPARNRNLIIEQAFEHGCSHVMFIDDDTAFKPDLLTKLLAHDKDIVTALYLMRNYPHFPIIFDVAKDNGSCRHHLLNPGEEGLVEIVNCGLGACLIKTDVFRAMEKPWITLGELEKDQWCDDISFFNRARVLGYKIYCDLDTPVGHMASMIVWPQKMPNGEWMTVYDTQGTGTALVPQAKLEVANAG